MSTARDAWTRRLAGLALAAGCAGPPVGAVAHNAVTCRCRFVVPLACTPPGCGLAGTGTHPDGDACVIERDERFCLRDAAPVVRCDVVADVLRIAVHSVYLDACGAAVCAASVVCAPGPPADEPACDDGCADEPLAPAGNWANWTRATYVDGLYRFSCPAEHGSVAESARLCRRFP